MLKAPYIYNLIYIVVAFFVTTIQISAQNSFGSSEELKQNAENYFENDQYVKAFPLYSQLLSLDRDDPDLQYRFGVCLLYSDRSDTYAPIRYLKKALNQVSTPDIYYHLGFAHHINYDFPSAISFYKEYQVKAGKKQKESFEVERKIEMCRNGMEMMRSVKDLFVLDKSEVAREEFFRSYNLENYGGKMIKRPENFLSKEDEKSKTKDFIFFGPTAKSVYYAGYGKDHKKQRDIYVRHKSEDGWSAPAKLSQIINTPYDENYPVLMPDGKTLYFSSKGHNTIGGYDVFKSVYNEQTKSWSVPENINFPFNTPTDDILFVPDTLESTAWFASVRNSVDEKIMVYKVGILKRPDGSEDLAAIYAMNKQLTEEDLKAIKDRAKLDINISEQEFDEVPEPEIDLIAQAEKEHQQNLQKISEGIKKKEQEQVIIDSAKFFVDRLENNIESFDSLRQKAAALAASKRLESKRIRDEVKSSLALAATASGLEGIQKATDLANKNIRYAEKLDYEASELDAFEKDIKERISNQTETFADINTRYGDAEQAVLNGSPDRALAIIGGMNAVINDLPQITDINSPITNHGTDLNIQYPAELTDNSFQAFVVNTQGTSPQVESFEARYDEYIPKLESKQIAAVESEYSNNPSVRLQEYINTLSESRQSFDIQISEIDRDIEGIKNDFENLPDNEKQNQLKILNQLEEEKGELNDQRDWIAEQVDEKQEELRRHQLSSADVNQKMDSYQSINKELEDVFDFNKKVFLSGALIPKKAEITTFGMSSQGTLVEKTSETGLALSSDLEFNNDNSQLIESQATEILAKTRSLKKENQFLLRKIDNKTSQLGQQARELFNESNQLLQNSRGLSEGEKQTALVGVNDKFKEAYAINNEFLQYQEKQKEIANAIENQEALINKLESEYDEVNRAISNNDYDNVERLYKSMENTYRNNNAMADFSAEINYEQGEILNQSFSENTLENDVYQLSGTGEIVKTIGNARSDWNTFESFSREIANPVQSNLLLSPNINLQTRQAQFTNIFEPQQPTAHEEVTQISVEIPGDLASSENSLVKNSISQTNSLESKTNDIARRRNVVNNYYKDQLNKALEKEQESLELLSESTVTIEALETANQLATDSKIELYKASAAASIIRQYDEKLNAYSSLITQSLNTANEVNQLISGGNQDEALLKNVQLQRDISAVDNQQIDESGFNFAVNEIFVEIPQEFYSEANQEFVIINGQVQRNSQPEINQLFYEESYPVKIESFENHNRFASAETAIATDEGLAENNAQANSGPTIESNQNESIPINEINQSNANTTVLSPAIVSIQSYNPQSFENVEDFRQALSGLNSYGQEHLSKLNGKSASLIQLAEEKLNKSNEFSLQSETAKPANKAALKDSSKRYLYEAMAIKQVAESFEEYVQEEQDKQEQITQVTFEIENKLESNKLNAAKQDFISLQEQVEDFDNNIDGKIAEVSEHMINDLNAISGKMDSAYKHSQELANQSVKLLSDASEERDKAEGKRNAFKRREHLKLAEEKELEATRLQNESENALTAGNQFYQQKAVLEAFVSVSEQVNNIAIVPSASQLIANNQEAIFENIDSRRAEVFDGQFNTTTNEQPETQDQSTPLAETNDIHVYQRENFKAEMISEELDLLKREIALLVQSQSQSLSEKEDYIVSKKIGLLRQKADSLEYEANKAFEFANRVLESLSEEEQRDARNIDSDFNAYLSDLKGKIELLLSEAASLKQRAQRSNNLETRQALFDQAKDKEEVAMYLILEEFEVIAQKNKTRYRRNQLILEQLLMDKASPEERELMRNIFAQIDDYFAQAEQKRKKANEPGTSFNMKKILLQDAYSLEMKGLDLQQIAKTLIEENDKTGMMAYQPEEETEIIAQQEENLENTVSKAGEQPVEEETPVTTSETGIAENNLPQEQNIPIVNEGTEEGLYYKIQFTALKELKNTSDFPGISEVTAERVAGTDYIRYFSGKFDNMDDALIRRNSIRASGYRDAFIKSWQNGEEVNLLSLNPGQNNTSVSSPPSFTTETRINNIDFSATNISSLQGVYYTVQVGVYSRPRTSAMIFGISPLYHKRMDNGYWIYYSGIFKSIANAEIKKEEIRQKGVSDAFVVAFNNGEQVNLAEARLQISRGEETPSDDAIVILEDASVELNRQWNQNRSNTTVTPENPGSDKLVYKVQVGVYSNPVNLDWIGSQLDNNMAVERYQNANGKYVYTIGNLESENQARELLREVTDIIPDAFLVGFQNGQKRYIR